MLSIGVRMICVAVLAASSFACNDARDLAPRPTAATPPTVAQTASPPVRVSTEVELVWSDIRTTPGCFYFSGPDGRDDRLTGRGFLERDGARVKLTIRSAEFLGGYQAKQLALYRVSAHAFTTKWLAFESMHGRYAERTMQVRYHYNECDTAGDCPGRCTIDANLELVVPYSQSGQLLDQPPL